MTDTADHIPWARNTPLTVRGGESGRVPACCGVWPLRGLGGVPRSCWDTCCDNDTPDETGVKPRTFDEDDEASTADLLEWSR